MPPGMTVNILERWKKCHNTLPKTIFYYRPLGSTPKGWEMMGWQWIPKGCTAIPPYPTIHSLRDDRPPLAGDGVSDGQFVNVLTRELNLLEHGFKQIDATYNPQLVIIVGQRPVR